MKTIGIVSLFFALLSVILSSESGDYNELMEEKARIKAIIETKPTPGRVIFVAHSVEPKMPLSATKVAAEFEAVEATATPTHEPKPRKSKKDDHQDEKKKEKDDESEEEEEEKSVSKKKKETRITNKKGKKSSSSESNESDEEQDNVNGLPKRLFRPRFRADSSADTVKMFSSTTFLIALSISLLAVYFI
jgi:outer membrane biosynthesis protein TonB